VRFRARWSQDPFGSAQHADIEEMHNLPLGGRAFDAMTRGSAEIDYRTKQVRIEGGEVAPKYDANDVIATFQKAYKNFKVLHIQFEYRE
jgi:hypothetical protein